MADLIFILLSLFDVKMEVDAEKFVPPKVCTKVSPQAATDVPSFKLFRWKLWNYVDHAVDWFVKL